MRKVFFLFLLCITFFSGCVKNAEAPDETAEFPDAVKLSSEIKYFNDYLGISYTVPKGWWLYETSVENFAESTGDITDDISMDIGYGDYEDYTYSTAWLLSFGNLENSTQDNHLGFNLEASALEGINDISGFMEYSETFMLEPTGEEEYGMLARETISINGKDFELRDYSVSREEDNYCIMTLTCAAEHGYFFTIMVDYWPDNTRAKQAIIDTVTKAVEFY